MSLPVLSLFIIASASGSLDPASLFASADANGDGLVSKAEFIAARDARFDVLDTNRDGFLVRDEMAAAAPGLRGRMMLPVMFPQFDSNGDGKVSRQEFSAAPAPGFDMADANGDGMVSPAEAKAAM
ncbi:MAG TPA: EF-hand domain-containing protein [Pseudothauera hydrothermalis]|nr:EF-hand domain-containing protein [Pseudothauera hydrothermalis]